MRSEVLSMNLLVPPIEIRVLKGYSSRDAVTRSGYSLVLSGSCTALRGSIK